MRFDSVVTDLSQNGSAASIPARFWSRTPLPAPRDQAMSVDARANTSASRGANLWYFSWARRRFALALLSITAAKRAAYASMDIFGSGSYIGR
eukprot:gene9342-biopygen15113